MKKIDNKRKFLKKSKQTLGSMLDMINSLPKLQVDKLSLEKTVVVSIDMINGFAKEGALYSPRTEESINESIKLLDLMKDYKKIFVVDRHDEKALEFNSYPSHCLQDSKESEIVDELKGFIDDKSITVYKNSTNAFVTPEFGQWVMENKDIRNFVLTGCCTDICLMQLALSLKTFYNEWNVPVNIIIPINTTETYDYEMHDGDLLNVVSLYMMQTNGIQLVSHVE